MDSADVQYVDKISQDPFGRSAIAAVRQPINDFVLSRDVRLADRDVALNFVQFLGTAAELVLLIDQERFKSMALMLRHACGFKLANQDTDTARCKPISAIAIFSTRCDRTVAYALQEPLARLAIMGRDPKACKSPRQIKRSRMCT
jgi:hypothetical protein